MRDTDNKEQGSEEVTLRLPKSVACIRLQELALDEQEKMHYVEVMVGGFPLKLLVDSGACVTTLHQGMVESLGIPTYDTGTVVLGFRGYEEKLRAADLELELCGRKIAHRVNTVREMPTTSLFEELGLPVMDGILGNDVFVKYKGTIDYFNNVICLVL